MSDLESIAALGAGLVFGAGLVVSGMSNPAKVLGFLDVFGSWDPSLALVMGGAVAVGLVGFSFAGARATSALGLPMRLPKSNEVDLRLVAGSALFGVGWGLAGFCPGPAVVALMTGSGKALLFGASMLAGMALYEWITSAGIGAGSSGSREESRLGP
ncbi:MAG: DUF6691 family protein [Usitatibacter sp.]